MRRVSACNFLTENKRSRNDKKSVEVAAVSLAENCRKKREWLESRLCEVIQSVDLLRDVASARASCSFFATPMAGNPTSNGASHKAGISGFSSLEGTKRPGDEGLMGSVDEKNVWEGRRGCRVQQPLSIFSETFSVPPVSGHKQSGSAGMFTSWSWWGVLPLLLPV